MSNENDPYRGAFEQSPPAGGTPPPRHPGPVPPPRPPTAGAPPRPSSPPPSQTPPQQGPSRDWPTQVQSPVDPRAPGSAPSPYPPDSSYEQEPDEGYYTPSAAPAPAPRYVARPAPARDGLPVPARRSPTGGATVEGEVALDHVDIRGRKVPPKVGWRRVLHTVTRINLGPGKDEAYELALNAKVQRTIRTTFVVGVLGLKGGVGKTVVTEGVGSTVSHLRGDRVIAMDADPDGGNLVMRHGQQNQLSILELVSDESVSRFQDVRAHTSQNPATRLEVLAAPDYAISDRTIEQNDFLSALTILQEHYAVVFIDCGIGLKTALMESILAESGALVVVTNASIDAMQETRDATAWLRRKGYQRLLDTAVLAINRTEAGRPNVDLPRAVEQFSREFNPKRIFELPFDKHVHEGKEITFELLSKKSRRRYLEIASALSDLYPKSVH